MFDNRARRQSGFPTFISCQRQDVNVLPKRRQSHQGDKLCDVSTVPLVARWPVFLARGSDADGGPHFESNFTDLLRKRNWQSVWYSLWLQVQAAMAQCATTVQDITTTPFIEQILYTSVLLRKSDQCCIVLINTLLV